jgi:hypothetical protein
MMSIDKRRNAGAYKISQAHLVKYMYRLGIIKVK